MNNKSAMGGIKQLQKIISSSEGPSVDSIISSDKEKRTKSKKNLEKIKETL